MDGPDRARVHVPGAVFRVTPDAVHVKRRRQTAPRASVPGALSHGREAVASIPLQPSTALGLEGWSWSAQFAAMVR
jgi:hypothetical protein